MTTDQPLQEKADWAVYSDGRFLESYCRFPNGIESTWTFDEDRAFTSSDPILIQRLAKDLDAAIVKRLIP